jgi:diguanylate cyclase (GGDEF)-like protein/PAS domain S-box-containing protein
VIDQWPEALLVQDEQSRFVVVNDAASRRLGYSREELLTMTGRDLNPDFPLELENSTKGGGGSVFQSQYTAKNGEKHPIEASASIFEANDQKTALTLARGLSDPKPIENTLRFVADPREGPNFLAALARHVGETLGVAYAFISRLADEAETAESVAFYAKGEITPNIRYSLDGTPCECVSAKRTCSYARDVQARFPNDRMLVDMGVESYAGTPLWDSTGKAIGLIAIMDVAPFHNETAVTQLLQLVAPRAAAELERSDCDRQLHVREQEFRSLAENLPDIVIRYDRECRRTFVSPSYERVTGLSPDAAIGKSPLELWSKSNNNKEALAFQAHLQKVMETGQACEWEMNWTTADQGSITFEVRGVPEFGSDSQIKGVLTVSRDVTARRVMETQLRMAASVFEAAREGIVITDPSGRILDVNPAFSRISGHSRDEVLGKSWNLFASGLQNRSSHRNIRSGLSAKGAWAGEVLNRRKSGELYTARLDAVAVNDDAGTPKYYVGIFSDISELKQHERHLQHIAHHDALTGLPNRLLLTDRLSQAIALAKSAGRMLAVLYFDMDGFKPINDNHGHEMGDRMLNLIASRLSENLREDDTVARIGGDEFVVLLTISNVAECEAAARRLLDVINQPIMLDGHSLGLSASMGISLYPDDKNDDADILLRYADQAMYFAKAAGRNQFVFFGSQARPKIKGDDQMIHDLRQALNQSQISVHYQPIIDMTTGRVVKAEALVRWRHPARGAVPPSEFIPVAENGGLIHEIGDLVFKEAARVAQSWNRRAVKSAGEHKRVSVNRSPRQFFGREGVTGWVRHLVEQDIPGHFLGIEITESLLLDDQPNVIAQLNQLRALGVAVSLDDFGTGYSALSYLKKFDIDYLKIDRSFVRDIVNDASDRAIVEAIIAMAKRLGIKLIAEGVETCEQANLLAAVGCDLVQGFFYAKPMPEAEFFDFVLAPPHSFMALGEAERAATSNAPSFGRRDGRGLSEAI